MAQDSARQLPRATMVAQTRLFRTAAVPKWKPKAIKICKKNQNQSSFLIMFRIVFSSVFERKVDENLTKNDPKKMKKTSRRKIMKMRKTFKNLRFFKVFCGPAGPQFATNLLKKLLKK